MTNSRVIPTQASPDLPTFTILIDGEDIGSNYGVLGIMVSKSVNRIPKARVLFMDGDPSAANFFASSGDLFVPGKKIEIKAGYHNIEDLLFKGIIVGHSIKSIENRNSLLQVDASDEAVKMTVYRKNKYFEETKDSDVIEEIVSSYGLSHNVKQTEVEHAEMVQYDATDWDFVITRAEVNSLLVFVDDGHIEVASPDFSKDPVLNLVFGDNIISFEAAMDARDQHSAYTSKAWDYSSQSLIEEESEEPGFSELGNISAADLAKVVGEDNYVQQHGARIKDSELKAWANSKSLRSRLAKIKGRVRTIGFSDIKPGNIINLEGFGDRFNGHAFVSSVNHERSGDSAWYTDIRFGLDAQWHINRYDDISTRQAAGLLPPVHGLQIGVVTNIHEDPDGENRIKVRLPLVDKDHEGVWARMVSPDAGNERGMVFRPELNDEVSVGFINDDPRNPIILGMLHSSSKPSPIQAEEENNEKGMVTRSALKLLFNDEKKSVSIETPNGNKWVLSDEDGGIMVEDENSNTIILSSDGIKIKSSGNLELEASGDVSITGSNIEFKATTAFKAEGNAGAELSSNGQTEVKGSIVSIN